MKHVLFLFLLLFVLFGYGQDTKPVSPDFKPLQAPNSATFYYYLADSSVWIYKGQWGWTKLAGATDFQQQIDSLVLEGSTFDPDVLIPYRLITNHDSLSTLEEKSYNSLDDLPDLTTFFSEVYEVEVTVDGTVTYALPFTLKSNAIVSYQGSILRNSQWFGAGSTNITLNIGTRINDIIKIQN